MNFVSSSDLLVDDDLPLPAFADIFSEHMTNGSSAKKRKKSYARGSSDEYVQDETTG
jgi:hypothetical protein